MSNQYQPEINRTLDNLALYAEELFADHEARFLGLEDEEPVTPPVEEDEQTRFAPEQTAHQHQEDN